MIKTIYEDWFDRNESRLEEEYPFNRKASESDFQAWCYSKFEEE